MLTEVDHAVLLDRVSDLRATIGRFERRLRKEAPSLPFSPTQLAVLGAVARLGPVSMSDLATEERLSPPSVSKVVAVLEAHGIVERIADERDRRVWRVRTTPAGVAWIAESRAERHAWLAARFAELDLDDQDVIMRALPVLDKLIDGNPLASPQSESAER